MKRLTSTVNSFIEAVVTVSGPVAEFVEVNTFLHSDALYVVERTSDDNLMCTYKKKKKSFIYADSKNKQIYTV